MNDPYQPVWENLSHETAENSHGDTDRPHSQSRPDSGMNFPGASGQFATPPSEQQPAIATLPRSTKSTRTSRGNGSLRNKTLVISLVLVAVLVALALIFFRGDGKSNPANLNPTQATIGPGGQFATLKDAIDRKRPEQKDLLLLGDLTDGPIRITGTNTDGMTIRPFDKDRVISWTPAATAGPADFVLKLDTLRNFRISGIDFKLGDKVRGAIEIKGPCAGMSLKDIRISGGKEVSMMLSCKGTKEAPVHMQNLRITNVGSKAAIEMQAGVNHLRIDDCIFIGEKDRSGSGLLFDGSFDEVELSRLRIVRFNDGIMIPSLLLDSPRRLRLTQSTISETRAALSINEVSSTISPKVELQFENNFFAKSGSVIWYTSNQGVWPAGMTIRGENNGSDRSTKPIDAKITNPNNARPEPLLSIQMIDGTFSTDESNLDTFLRPDPESPLGKSKFGYPGS